MKNSRRRKRSSSNSSSSCQISSNAIPFPAGAFADRGRTLRLIIAGASERRIVAAHAAEQRKFIARERATLNNRISLDASGLSDTLSAAG